MFKLFKTNLLLIRLQRNSFYKINKANISTSQNKSNDEIVIVSESNGIRRVTLNNPRKRNALSLSMIQHLIKHINDSPSLRCIVINANGSVFSSGHDLKELTPSTGKEFHDKVFKTCSQFMCSLQSIEVPVICQINGIAAAAGCQLVASCDISIASSNSQFSTPGASVGLFCSTPGIAVSRAANLKMASYMVLTGNSITAQEALQSGLVSRVVDSNDLENETEKTIESIMSKSKAVIALGKKFFYAQLNQSLEQAYNNGNEVMVKNLSLLDAQEGITSFIEKRHPKWSHTDKKVC